MTAPTKETDAWFALNDSQKSRFVRALHWFHFRPDQLARSWKREEVITWELLGALQILPRSYFLGDLLKRIAQQAPEAEEVCSLLLGDLHDIEIEEYPSLQLGGKLHNRRSDVGFRIKEGPRLWIEIKTLRASPAKLVEQLEDQKAALSNICSDSFFSVVALLPATQSTLNWPIICWSNVVESLDYCIELLGSKMDSESSRGYLEIAEELKNRICHHTENISYEA